MNITIVGMGHAGTTIAADLTLKGHRVTLLKTSDNIHNMHHQYMMRNMVIRIRENGAERSAHIHKVTDNFDNSFQDAELIILFIQTNYHKQVIDRMIPHLRSGHTMLLEPGYLSTAYLVPTCEAIDLTVVEAESSPIDCRIVAPGCVEVLFRNVRNPVGVFPRRNREAAAILLEQLDYPLTYLSSVVEAALHNPNLIVHTIGAIMSMPRIEFTGGEYWMYREVFTPSIWKLVEQLDSEKMDILARLGYTRLPYIEACKERNCIDTDQDALNVFNNYAQNSSPKGPSEVKTRYITEDVPEGLVLMESFGAILNVPTPICSALINIASTALDIPFRDSGRTVDKLNSECVRRILNDTGIHRDRMIGGAIPG
jgi:opine dehydrogenase